MAARELNPDGRVLNLSPASAVHSSAVRIRKVLPGRLVRSFDNSMVCVMLLSDAQLLGAVSNEILVKIICNDGRTHTTRFSVDCLVEQVKKYAVDFFFTNNLNTAGTSGGSIRYKLVRVSDTHTLRDFLTLQQEQVTEEDELLVIERGRGSTDAVKLWELGTVQAPTSAAIVAATARLAAPRSAPPHPDLQALLTTNEVTKELQKILISLIEVGARLAAGGRNYEATLCRLSEALEQANGNPLPLANSTVSASASTHNNCTTNHADHLFWRAECLQRFLEKFRIWRSRMVVVPYPEAIENLKQLGFTEEEATRAFQNTGQNEPAAALWLVGERGSSIFELINGLPEGAILQSLLKQPAIQRGLLNTRMLLAFISIVAKPENASLWLSAPHGGPLLQQILRTYHSEKYCSAVNQYSKPNAASTHQSDTSPSTSRSRH